MAKAENTLGKKPFLGAGILAILMASGLYLWEKRPQIPEESPRLPGAGLVLPEFTPTLVPIPTETPVPTSTATPEGPKSLPYTISIESLIKAGIGLVPWTTEDISKAQQEAMVSEGIFKVALPYDFLEMGGEVRQDSSRLGLYFILKKQTTFSFTSLTGGEVVDVVRSGGIPMLFNFTSIKLPNNMVVNYGTLTSNRLLVEKGQRIGVGQSIISGEFVPNSDEQKKFETPGYPQNTVVVIAYKKLGGDKLEELSFPNIIRDKEGNVVVISSLK